jgi:hypothetical protein
MSNSLELYLYFIYFSIPEVRSTSTPPVGTKPAIPMVTINFVEVRRCVLQKLP